MASKPGILSRNTLIGEIGVHARKGIKRTLMPLGLVCATALLGLYVTGTRGAEAFTLIVLGTFVVLATWSAKGRGIPIVPMIAIQNLIAYGLPILVKNQSVYTYPAEYVTKAGWQVFIFSVSLTLCWRMAQEFFPKPSPYCYALHGFDTGSDKLARFGVIMVIISSVWEILRSLQLLWMFLSFLPYGSESILRVIVSAVGTCGFFLCGMMIGAGTLTGFHRFLFWSLLALQCVISASGFLLSAAAVTVFAAMIGLFWGSGRVPWRFLTITLLVFSFLNLGKFVMRERYWPSTDTESAPDITLTSMPRYYSEWVAVSFDVLTGKPTDTGESQLAKQFSRPDDDALSGQSLLQRINNLQNLLFVIDAMESRRIPALDGATYEVIPPLLVPRILWPSKPRTHEGQIMLNVHFGRQDSASTLRTYVAWGLLAEAYGNFGSTTGAIVLGMFLGVAFAWLEGFVSQKLLLSVEGFLSFTLFLGLANSFEMVASVLVTALFQACIPVICASWPFVRRMNSQSVTA